MAMSLFRLDMAHALLTRSVGVSFWKHCN